MWKIIIGFINLFLFISCTSNSNKSILVTCNIDSISVVYFNYNFVSSKSIDCNNILTAKTPTMEEDGLGLLDATFYDESILKEICEELKLLEPSKNQYPLDTRLAVKIYKKNKIEYLCSDGYRLFKDGVLLSKNNRLLYLLKNNAGYYSWFKEEELMEMDELSDTTFVKEPFVISPYYEEYRKTQLGNVSD